MRVLITGVGAVAQEPRPAADGTDDAWFDPVPHLGRRGWKYLSPATRYLLAAGNEAIGRRHSDEPLTGTASERFGVVAGTEYAIAGVHRRMYDTLRTEGVRGISPAEVPAFSMNTPASQLAISAGARAFSATVTNPVTAGLEAVHFAATALRTGRADRVVAAATDQTPPGVEGLGHDAAAAVLLTADAADVPGGPVDGSVGGSVGGSYEGALALAEITGGVSRFVPVDADGRWNPVALALGARRIAALAAGVEGSESTARPRLVVSAPAAAHEFAVAVREAVGDALDTPGGGVRDRHTEVQEARHCAVSGLLELVTLAKSGESALVVSVSGSGRLTAIALGNASRP
ncbi:hypothetical protein MTQ01_03580 [Streptomyces sp. XM4193]|uniref:beta-ketoacyl synthase N-terminal-like domain-containing protein n=1 Tax=Streptomyces sp. XM4193 TaxID=2929782 RepID=UPI001FFB0BA2|nr:beta-ketoacyl synthase N-terminal-like domain-containing protein [Streptomyces sp. XM4193]MCK1795105.1 hypothetical protein [Streptomyces sp. XM4193]